MEDIAAQIGYPVPVLMIVVGAVLLLFGRKLYWLAVGGVGFLLGLALVSRIFTSQSELELLAMATVAGILGVMVAFFAQKIAVTVAGFAIGGMGAYQLALPYVDELQIGIWWIAVLGAVLGVCFAAFLFNTALVLVSAVTGAMLVAQNVPQVFQDVALNQKEQGFLFIALFLVGIAVQAGRKNAPKVDDD